MTGIHPYLRRVGLNTRDVKLTEALVLYLKNMTRLGVWTTDVCQSNEWLLETYEVVANEITRQSLPAKQTGLLRMHDDEAKYALRELAGDLAFQRLSQSNPSKAPPLEGKDG